MFSSKIIFAACVAFAVCCSVQGSSAAPGDIGFEGAVNGDFVISDSSDFVSNASDGYFYYANVSSMIEGVSTPITYLEFFDSGHGGGLSAASDLTSRLDSYLNVEGPQVFSGPVTNPTFVGGTYSFPLGEIIETVNVPGVAVLPLPASAPMFGAALAGLGALGYRLKRKAKALA